MKMRFTVALSAALLTTAAMAQDRQDVVYLKNGSVVHGTVVEFLPTEKSLTIETALGDSVVCQMDDVARFAKEKPTQGPALTVGYPARGYRGFIEGAALFGNFKVDGQTGAVWTAPALFTTHGFQFNSHIFAGGGIGIMEYGGPEIIIAEYIIRPDDILYADYPQQVYDHVSTIDIIPVYLAFRYDLLDRRVSPYADAKLGLFTGDYYGRFMCITAGIRIRHFNVSLGYMGSSGTYDRSYDDSSYDASQHSFVIQAGFDIGHRR